MAWTVNFQMTLQRHSFTQRFRQQMHRQNDQSDPQRFLHITSCKYIRAYLKYFKVKPMFKQHVNLLI